jgi:spore germination cell wall hydrolase CwlJ-like protein
VTTTNFNKVDEFDLLIACLRGEAEGESFIGKLAIACVIRNRVNDKRWPDNYKAVILQPLQFSCFLPECFRPEILVAAKDKSYWRECKYAAFGVYHGWIKDITNGANHYHTKGVSPSWSSEMKLVFEAGNHLFFKG